MNQLPEHLQKYIVDQDYSRYTPVDQACWRFIIRQLRSFLREHGHPFYLEGMAATGITVESIPSIESISQKLQRFGWRALPVSGFLPPAAFMELQSLNILPIASDMRTLDHLLYTPAPDIVHEAAGHAPMLAHPEYAKYLKEYAQVARKAILSSEDLDVYEAIRVLSDTKEDPAATPEQVEAAQKQLEKVSRAVTHTSEAGELSRMNWWTAEYGLIGSLDSPQIFGAGLLSSVGESRLCLSNKVRKIPLTLDCIEVGYDITEPQPQLFVTPDFQNLSRVLQQLANRMAFRRGGLEGLSKALKSGAVCTVELNSGIQISGQLAEIVLSEDKHTPCYLRLQGASQLSYLDVELPGHGTLYHSAGFGTAVGKWQDHPELCPSLWSDEQLAQAGITEGKISHLKLAHGVRLEGRLRSKLRRDGKLILLSFENCTVKHFSRVLFEPSWGVFDLAIGSTVVSVFGGPADRSRFGDIDDFVTKRVPQRTLSQAELKFHDHYRTLRNLRENAIAGSELTSSLETLLNQHWIQFPQDWLLTIESLELLKGRQHQASELHNQVVEKIETIQKSNPQKSEVIADGLRLASQLEATS